MEGETGMSPKGDEKKGSEKRTGEKKDSTGQKRVRNRPNRSKNAKKEAEAKGEPAEKAEDQKQNTGEAAPKKRKQRRNKKKKTKKEAKEAKESGDFNPKIKLKVIIRRLPPNLPEHIFWQAISPWVLRSESQKGVAPTEDKSGSLAESSSSKVPFADQAYFVPGKLKDGSRRGVQADSNASPHTFSRAYIRFHKTDDLVNFHRGFDGHLFRDSKGNEYFAVVEFAPFQRMPEDGVRRKKPDTLAGTIEEDEHYKQFVSILTQTEAELAQEKGQGQLEKTDAQLMAHLTSLSADSQNAQKQAKSTPLLEHLRAQRLAKSGTSAQKQSRTGKTKSAKGTSGSKSKAKAISDPSIPTGPKAMVQKQKDSQKTESGNKKSKKSEKSANSARLDKNSISDHAENNVTQTKKQPKKEQNRTNKAEGENSGVGKIASNKNVTPKIPSSPPAKIAILKREMKDSEGQKQTSTTSTQTMDVEQNLKQPPISRGRRGRGAGSGGDT
ncbi:uncharacterized protein FA14DRAFT_183631 [Meira miltonrushii]|uniref:UPF3 domain-containing protein n=1 Tax=Meira miltonrushii TaxID=1280837 RepID=A0A316VJF9_9BASI|nr:uncharacterized protein FA14DRAFT_183631 [Meira miltonrushii]PWN37817.1 hypothetical protein FA14DRAFT_183631 [Meira miltonrushii]